MNLLGTTSARVISPLDSAISQFLLGIRFDKVDGQDKLDGENAALRENLIVDQNFRHLLSAVKEAASAEDRLMRQLQMRFYVVLITTAVLIVACFGVALLVGGEGLPSLVGKTGVFASIVSIFGLYLDFERRSLAAARSRANMAVLLKNILEAVRDPVEQAKVIRAAGNARKNDGSPKRKVRELKM